MNKAVSTGSNLHVIAGGAAGNKVCANTPVFKIYNEMAKLAVQGNHWAFVSVSQIRSLSSGHSKNTVFVRQNNGFDKLPNFTMILPGCKAQVLKRSNGEYLVYKLEIDDDYQKLHDAFRKPALFHIKKGPTKDWITELAPMGLVKSETNRIVTISDQYLAVGDAVDMNVNAASNSPIGGGRNLKALGFDMHFTPG